MASRVAALLTTVLLLLLVQQQPPPGATLQRPPTISSSTAVVIEMLHCLCPFILGDVNKMLPKPIDPVRMMELPIACGVVLPPQVLYVCFTGRPSPPVVTNFPQKNSESGQSP